MIRRLLLLPHLVLLADLAPRPALAAPPRDEIPIACDACAAWSRPRAPFRVHGETYYVGVAGLSSVLVATPAGLVLLDGGLPQSAEAIAANLAALGRDLREVKLILTSHAHFDHVGGVAALRRRSGARVLGSAPTVAALAAGRPTPDHPQARSGGEPARRFPIVTDATVVRDGEVVTLGGVAFTAHLTPGHTPGATTWTWRSCAAAGCADVVYADSLNAVSDEGFRFSDDAERVARFHRSIDAVAALPCDLLIPVHPDFAVGGARPFFGADACRRYAARARQGLAARLEREAIARRY